MKTNLFLRRLLLLWVFAFSASLWGQTDIITPRSVVPGFSNWIDTDVAGGSSYPQLLKSTSSMITPAMNFDSYNGETLTFRARTFGGSNAVENIITVWISVDDGVSWKNLGTRTPLTSSMVAQTGFDLSEYNGTKVKVKFTVAGTSNTVGSGLDFITIKGNMIVSGPNLAISGTPVNHGNSCIGVPTSKVQYTIKNNGTVDAENVSVLSSGANASDFVVSGLSSTTIAAGASATFNVTFTPSASGARAAVVTVSSTTTDSNSPMLNLTGTGNATVAGTVTTSAETNVGNIAVQLNGNVTALGVCPDTTEKGFVWGVNADPTVSDNSAAVSGVATGTFNYHLTGLAANTVYHYRAYIKDANNVYTYGADRQFTTLAVADHLAFVNVPATGSVNSNLVAFSVEARRPDNSVDTSYMGSVVLSKASGTGILSGTTTKAFVNGVAAFSDIQFDAVGTYSLHGNHDSFAQITSGAITVAVGPCFSEDFSSITTGNSTSTSGSNTAWVGNVNFPTVEVVYQAGSSVRLGSGSNSGSITSKVLTQIGGDVTVSFDVKGWTTVEGDIILTFGGQSKTITYLAKIADAFESKSITFTNIPLGSTLKIATSAKRAFIDNVNVSCGTATVWNGTAWSNGVPDATKDVIIANDYHEVETPIEAKSVTVNEGASLIVNKYVNTGDVVNNGEITVANNANFVQTGTFTAGADSTFKVDRTTKKVKRLDYNSWSSPMKTSTQTLKQFSPATLDERFLTYNDGKYGKVDNPSVEKFEPGQGYLIRTPNNYTSEDPGVEFQGVFEGKVPNSGDITYSAAAVTGSYVFLGNPYPSAISMEDFKTANSQISGTFYIWNSEAKMIDNVYSGNIYITHTSMGSNPVGSPFYVPVGQGFFVDRGVTNTNSFIFNDGMRRTADTGTFGKATGSDRFWLQMAAPSGTKPQLLIGFTPDASAGYDAGYDAKMFGGNADVIYSTVDDKSLVINALGAFSTGDVVNVTANFLAAGNYTMSIAQKEGIFANGQKIYLKDHVTGTETELTAGDYTFAATAGLQADRFTVTFSKGVLAAADIVKGKAKIFADRAVIYAKAPSPIATIEVYDMSGRLMQTVSGKRATDLSFSVNHNGMVVVKMTLENGEITTNRLLLKK
ncbi:choice-of-anchor D domain-containing protein [Chryseobacterium sp. MDT2-18]|uniref:choice-of-anchor D domain-containing protein n=1 Tax=Chryseobacterium sp. MDT2-18 TaxID=1259136 RepID=UPI00278B319D|nr:choice-of-anchor D domain-containing protein [Chryseobacterium sp. MDT2-18]MDQ0478192.1 hypothetical protein [Chryseobacterium sp. MDT2-18]